MNHKKSLLIIDDDDDIRRSLAIIFRKKGYETEAVGTGRKAIARVQVKSFDLVLVDIKLPDMQGLDLIVPFKKIRPDMVIILITAYASLETAVRALDEGVSAYITKPLSVEEVLVIVRQALEKQDLVFEKRQMEREKIQLEKIGALGTLTAGIAHSMNNPMMGILNFIQYCIKHTAVDDKRYTVLQDAERATLDCIDIVRKLLIFSCIKPEEEEYTKTHCAVLITRVLGFFTYRIETEGVSVSVHDVEGTPEIWIKVSDIQQVFLNLIGNAFDAVKKKSRKQIYIDVCSRDDHVQITVADSGIGVAPENISKIFDPFFTTKPVGQGTGLGLSVSRGIVEDHGGTISCQSELDAGATFTIRLPTKRQAVN